MPKTSFVNRLDIYLFYILFALILLYKVQLLSPLMVAVFKIRYVLYIYLYLRIAIFYKWELNTKKLLVLIFLYFTIFIAIHTYFLYGKDVAIAGLTRFINVALLAPLASVLFENLKQFQKFINLWLFVIVIGGLTLIYQLLGGDLSWLVESYIASRGILLRFNTLLGGPNTGGMASAITYIIALLIIRPLAVKIVLLTVALILLIFSLSKAAIAGWIIATAIIVCLKVGKRSNIFKINRTKFQKMTTIMIVTLLFIFCITTYSSPIREYIVKYATIALLAFTGGDTGDPTSQSVLEDLSMRMISMTQKGISLAMEQSSFYPLNFLVGSSFGIAGSAAFQLKADVILPHNTFSEIYLVGGILLLFIFGLILVKTWSRLWLLNKVNDYYKALLIVFLTIVAYMPSYPIIYEPILGSLFWLIVGLVANSNFSLKKHSLNGVSISNGVDRQKLINENPDY